MKAPTTEYIFNTPIAKFNAGYQDAMNEMRWGGDRRFASTEATFHLPQDRAGASYRNGYFQAHEDRANGLVQMGADGYYVRVQTIEAKAA